MSALLQVKGVTKRFRGLTAVDQVSFDVAEGQIFAVIGPNGAGKTTLFNLIAGVFAPDTGSIAFAGERSDGVAPHLLCQRGLARTFQIVRPFPELTVLENATIGAMMRAPDVDAARSQALGDNATRASREDAELALAAAVNETARQQAALDQAQRQIDQYTIRAPMAGVVLSRGVDQGQLVDPQTELFVIADTSDLVVETGAMSISECVARIIEFDQQRFDHV